MLRSAAFMILLLPSNIILKNFKYYGNFSYDGCGDLPQIVINLPITYEKQNYIGLAVSEILWYRQTSLYFIVKIHKVVLRFTFQLDIYPTF